MVISSTRAVMLNNISIINKELEDENALQLSGYGVCSRELGQESNSATTKICKLTLTRIGTICQQLNVTFPFKSNTTL